MKVEDLGNGWTATIPAPDRPLWCGIELREEGNLVAQYDREYKDFELEVEAEYAGSFVTYIPLHVLSAFVKLCEEQTKEE